MVEYRLAKARVAGSNPVSCSQRDRKKSHPMDGSFFYVQALPGSNGSNVSAPLRSSQANVPRTFCDVSCSQRDRKKSHPMDGSFFYVRSLPGSNGSNVSAPVVAGERPPDVLRRLVLSMIQKRGIRWMALFCMFEPCRARTVRMSPLHCGRSNNFKCL